MFVVQMQHAEAQAWTEIAEWHPRHPKPVVHNTLGAENHVGASAAKPVAEPAEATDRNASTSSASGRRIIKAEVNISTQTRTNESWDVVKGRYSDATTGAFPFSVLEKVARSWSETLS